MKNLTIFCEKKKTFYRINIFSLNKIHQLKLKRRIGEEEKLYFTLLVAKSNPTPSKQTCNNPPSPVVQSCTGNSPPRNKNFSNLMNSKRIY